MSNRPALMSLLVSAAMVLTGVAVAPQSRTLAITRVSVVDVVDGQILPNRTIVISGGTTYFCRGTDSR